ncbi:MAG TPA: protease pro-enzyme activation domain-containing protein, partial [Verrucomicrobiae bacterium]
MPAWRSLAPVGSVAQTNELRLALSLPLRNLAELSELLQQIQDPASTNFHRYLTPEEFTSRFGPTPEAYQALEAFALTSGLRITERHPNRLVLDVMAPVSRIEPAFRIKLNHYRHPRQNRDFFAPDQEPSVDVTLPLLQISGLNNYALPQPHFHRTTNSLTAKAVAHSGSGPGSTYVAKDLLNAYLPGMTNLTGAGQSVGLLQFDGYYLNDIKSYTNTAGISPATKLINVAVDGGVSTPGTGNGEVALDIQMVLALAPGVSNIYVYEAPNPSPWVDLLSKMANDNKAKQLSCSWGDNTPSTPDTASEQIFLQMAAQGQSFFNASGDSDAFTNGIPFPSESTNITQVGATTLTTGTGAGYTSEQVWNWGVTRGTSYDGIGSSGGISLNFGLPYYQQGMTASLTTAGGSLAKRNVP